MPDPTRQELLNSIDAVLATIDPAAHVHTVRQADDAAYAAYVFGLVLRACDVVAEPGSLQLRSILNPNAAPQQFVVRGAPGYIFSPRRDYGYAEFTCNSRSYEVHLGVQFFGSSRVLHEFDIAVIDKQDATRARENRRSPTSGQARIVFECKFYTENIGISLGREFVGLLADFSSARSARLVTNSGSGSVRTYLTERLRFRVNDLLVPSDPDAETRFVHAVADDMRSRLR